jgi:hypothetical protein
MAETKFAERSPVSMPSISPMSWRRSALEKCTGCCYLREILGVDPIADIRGVLVFVSFDRLLDAARQRKVM